MEYYSVKNKKELTLLFVTTGIEREGTVLSEMSDRMTNTVHNLNIKPKKMKLVETE